jgi:hypothetical protein
VKGPDPGVDANAAVNRTTPLWGETRWHCCWNSDAGVGMYIHTGRFRRDLDMWWAHIAAYLPDGRLVVERLCCRNRALAGIESETLGLTQTVTGWTSRFDGVGEMTSTAGMARGVHDSGAPSVALRWDVTATNVAPVWDLYSSTQQQQDFASDVHVQRASRTTGTLSVGDEAYPLDGVGFKDHSSGARSFAAWNGHRFMIAVMPDWVVHAVTIFRGDDATMGVVLAGDRCIAVKQFDLPKLIDTEGGPREQQAVLTGPEGPFTAQVSLVHALPISITEDGDNYNGIDWDSPSDPLVMIEGMVRLTAPDGSVGFGFLERSARQSTLPRPTGITR